MPGTRTTMQLPGGGIAVLLDQQLTAIGAADWVLLAGNIALQLTGPATAVTVQLERSIADPAIAADPAPVGAPSSGNPSTGMAIVAAQEPAAAWWRARVTALTGASVRLALSGRGAPTPASIPLDRSPPAKLQRLRLSAAQATAGTDFSATVLDRTAGSVLSLGQNPGGRWSLSGTMLSARKLAFGVETPSIIEQPGTSGAIGARETEFRVAVAHAGSVALSIAGTPPAALVGNSDSFTPAIAGGRAPYSLSLVAGTLPPGRALSGLSVSGTYTAAGSYGYTLRVTDAAGATANLPVNVVVTASGALMATIPDFIVGLPYDALWDIGGIADAATATLLQSLSSTHNASSGRITSTGVTA